jgi:hypothetical protein
MKEDYKINFLEETRNALKDNNLTTEDVLWIGSQSGKYSINWGEFEKIANFRYYDGYGSAEIALDLVVVGSDWWLERYEYDGSEQWVFKKMPITNLEAKSFTKVKDEIS